MSSRRDGDRRDQRDREDYPSKRPTQRDAAPRPKLAEFWLDGEGIDRQVLQSTICRFLGPEATSRPAEYQGKPGFKIKAIRPFTPDMLDDLKTLSQDFVLENRANRGHNRDGESSSKGRHHRPSDQGLEVRYEESQTRRGKDPDNYEYEYNRDRNYGPSSGSYAMPGPYASDVSMQGYPNTYTSGPFQGNASYATMAPSGNMPAAYNDPAYQREYQYGTGSRDGGMPPAAYGYAPNSMYPDAARSRPGPEMQTGGYFPTAGAPVSRDMIGDPSHPRYSGYESMSGVQQTGGSYGVPSRTQNPSPYDTVPRDHYARPPPSAESYVARRR